MTRREFLKAAGAGAALAISSRASARARTQDQLRIGVIGVANRGADNLAGVATEQIAALCDVDERFLARAKEQYPAAQTFTDFRRMLEMKALDAVVISTPDHTHAPAAVLALEAGLHVYCEKPLAHSVWETRRVTDLARGKKRVTQLGTQIHAEPNYRRVVELVQSGAIGAVREVHCWVDRVWSGGGRPSDTPPIPEGLHWDLWLGPAPERPYHPAYHPHNWRGWWDFGGGTLADMACHHVDLPYWALDLKYPRFISAEGPPVNAETTPEWLIVKYEFPARGEKPPVTLTWYNGGKRPRYFAEGAAPAWGDGTLFVGEKGMLIADYGRHKLLPEKEFEGFEPPPPSIPDSIGHHAEWIQAIKTGGKTSCHFDYSGPLTETALLGNVAYRCGEPLEWDARRLRARTRSASPFLRPGFRPGWGI